MASLSGMDEVNFKLNQAHKFVESVPAIMATVSIHFPQQRPDGNKQSNFHLFMITHHDAISGWVMFGGQVTVFDDAIFVHFLVYPLKAARGANFGGTSSALAMLRSLPAVPGSNTGFSSSNK